MTTYVLRRLLISIPVVIGITIIIFGMAHLMPGDAVLAMVSVDSPMSDDLIAMRRGALGLDEPLPVQYMHWLGNVLRGNFGVSFISGLPIGETILSRVPATVELMGISLLFSIIFGIALGIVSALKQYSWIDYALTIFSFVGMSVPVFFLGMLLVYVFSLRLGWLPTSGLGTAGEGFSLVDNLRHLILPAAALGILRTAVFMRYTRTSMLEVLHSDFVMTARSKGLVERVVILRHVLRNALIPIVTIIGLSLPVLFGGAVFIETVFQWPGIGLLYINAVSQRDSPMIMGLALISALIVLVSNLLTDIAYALVDPRIRYD
jgi:peptide/nickel transport system permease protein